MRTCCILLLALALVACAETDPYKRLDPAPTQELSPAVAGSAFISRWPWRFKCVQTVTLDFGVQTRTLVGYLMVQQPDRFRLQGMTEQGLKLFDIVYFDNQSHVVFAAEEFDAKILGNISRDIRRVFLAGFDLTGGSWNFGVSSAGYTGFIEGPEASIRRGDDGTSVTFFAQSTDTKVHLVGDPPRVDWYDVRQSGRSLFRVDQYEWEEFEGVAYPTTVVLREPGIQSDGPAYKLTIKITELTVRDTPWPEKVFNPPEKDD